MRINEKVIKIFPKYINFIFLYDACNLKTICNGCIDLQLNLSTFESISTISEKNISDTKICQIVKYRHIAGAQQ